MERPAYIRDVPTGSKVIIGSEHAGSRARLDPVNLKGPEPHLLCTEMIHERKIACNAFLSRPISSLNEIAIYRE